jgi:DnaJ-class molecular chaperone
VDLADLYNGKVKKLAINRKVPVNPDEKPKPCDACDARGIRMMTRQIGPGMIQQMQVVCDSCSGMGYQIKMKQERHILECNIEKVELAPKRIAVIRCYFILTSKKTLFRA